MIDVSHLIATGRLPPSGGDNPLPRLRSDTVARRVMSGLQQSLNDAIPDGVTIILTISAPVRVPAATVKAIDQRLRREFLSRSAEQDFRESVLGNDVHVRIVNQSRPGAPKLVASVCNPEPSPIGLLDLIEAYLPEISHKG